MLTFKDTIGYEQNCEKKGYKNGIQSDYRVD